VSLSSITTNIRGPSCGPRPPNRSSPSLSVFVKLSTGHHT